MFDVRPAKQADALLLRRALFAVMSATAALMLVTFNGRAFSEKMEEATRGVQSMRRTGILERAKEVLGHLEEGEVWTSSFDERTRYRVMKTDRETGTRCGEKLSEGSAECRHGTLYCIPVVALHMWSGNRKVAANKGDEFGQVPQNARGRCER